MFPIGTSSGVIVPGTSFAEHPLSRPTATVAKTTFETGKCGRVCIRYRSGLQNLSLLCSKSGQNPVPRQGGRSTTSVPSSDRFVPLDPRSIGHSAYLLQRTPRQRASPFALFLCSDSYGRTPNLPG